MPSMPRGKNKGTKIAYAVLGKPQNMTEDKSKKNKAVEKRLVFEETSRIR